jgi:hypothetical protein
VALALIQELLHALDGSRLAGNDDQQPDVSFLCSIRFQNPV